MEKKDTRGIHNTLKRCTRSQVTQTLPIDSDSNGLREFTQLIHHDSVANICGGDTMMNDSDDDDDDERSGDTEVLPHNDDDDDDGECGSNVQSVLKHEDLLALQSKNDVFFVKGKTDLSLKEKNDLSLSRKHRSLDVSKSINKLGGGNVTKVHEFDIFKYDSDATTEEEREDEYKEYEHRKDADNACLETTTKSQFKGRKDTISDNNVPRKSNFHDIDSHNYEEHNNVLTNTQKIEDSSDKDSPSTLYASGSRPKSIGSVRAASLRASGLRAAIENARASSSSKIGTEFLRTGKEDYRIGSVATTHKLTHNGVNDELEKQSFEFVGTELLHDTCQVCDIPVTQTPPKITMGPDNANNFSPRMSTSRLKLNRSSTEFSQSKSRQKARKLVFDSKEEMPVFSNCKLENSDGKVESTSLQVDQKNDMNLTPLEQTMSLASGINVSTNLTCLESQEPGEESQRNALDVVDKLVWLDVTCTPQETVRNNEPVLLSGEGHLGTSGLKSLAQAAQMKALHEKMDVFDWIDSQAEEESPLAAKDISDKDKKHSKQVGASKLIVCMKKHFSSRKINQNGNYRKIAEPNIRVENAISYPTVVQSSAITQASVKNMEPSAEQGVKMHTLLTTRLKSRSRLESPSRKLRVASYGKRKTVSRKNTIESERLSARLLQKQKTNKVIEVKEIIEITPSERTKVSNESELGCVIQTSREAVVETDVKKPVVMTLRKRNSLSDDTTQILKKNESIRPARTIKLGGRKVSSDRRNGDAPENLLKEKEKIDMMRRGPKTRAKALDAKSKMHNKRENSIATKYNPEIRMSTNGKEETTVIECKRKRKAVSECNVQAFKCQKTESDASLPKSKILRSNKLKSVDIEAPILCKEINDIINKNVVQKPTGSGKKLEVHPEDKEETKGKKTNTLNSEKACQGHKGKPNTRGNRRTPISEVVSNLDSSVFLDERRRRKRNPSCIQVLFSHSLPEEITKNQKKILTKLGGHIATSASECTHFVSSSFVRTRNMLVSMASGKVVATPQWLESCSQAHYFVDEKNFILRDEKKEKELGFCMHSSLAAARRKPLLKGLDIVVTPNTTPDPEAMKEIIETAGGQVVQNTSDFLQSDASQGGKLVIADNKDYDYCIQFLENGFSVYSTELILHGIVTQHLDFSRNQILQRRNTRKVGKTNIKHK